MSASKIAIATILLLATFAGCEWYGTLIPPTHWAYAIFVNFIFLAVATALMTALELPLFPPSYFDSRRFEMDGRMYRWAGLRAFVGILRFIGWEKFWRKQIPVRNDLEALRKYAEGTRGSEAVHVVAGVCVVGLTLSIALRYSWAGTKWLWLANVFINLYPVALQRYNRPRVERLILRLARATNATSTEPADARESPS
ncbi:MAG: hypothetical protein R3C59_16880 [Planctomycetaceae bacterium]